MASRESTQTCCCPLRRGLLSPTEQERKTWGRRSQWVLPCGSWGRKIDEPCFISLRLILGEKRRNWLAMDKGSLSASPEDTPISQVYFALILAPSPSPHRQGLASLVSMVTSVCSPLPMSFPALRTWHSRPEDLSSQVENSVHPTSSTLDIANNDSHQFHHLLHSCFKTRCFVHIVSNADNSPIRQVLVFLLFRGSERLNYFPKVPSARLQPRPV